MVCAVSSEGTFRCAAAGHRSCLSCAALSEHSDAGTGEGGLFLFAYRRAAKMAGHSVRSVLPAVGSARFYAVPKCCSGNQSPRFGKSDGSDTHHTHLPVHLFSGAESDGTQRTCGACTAAYIDCGSDHRCRRSGGHHKACAAVRGFLEGRFLLPVHRR